MVKYVFLRIFIRRITQFFLGVDDILICESESQERVRAFDTEFRADVVSMGLNGPNADEKISGYVAIGPRSRDL